MLYDTHGTFTGTFCRNKCTGGLTWCRDHQTDSVLNARFDTKNWEFIDQDYLAPLKYVHDVPVRVVGHFDHAWKQSNWACSFNTMWREMKRFTENPGPEALWALRVIDFAKGLEKLETIFQKVQPVQAVVLPRISVTSSPNKTACKGTVGLALIVPCIHIGSA